MNKLKPEKIINDKLWSNVCRIILKKAEKIFSKNQLKKFKIKLNDEKSIGDAIKELEKDRVKSKVGGGAKKTRKRKRKRKRKRTKKYKQQGGLTGDEFFVYVSLGFMMLYTTYIVFFEDQEYHQTPASHLGELKEGELKEEDPYESGDDGVVIVEERTREEELIEGAKNAIDLTKLD